MNDGREVGEGANGRERGQVLAARKPAKGSEQESGFNGRERELRGEEARGGKEVVGGRF